MRVDAQSQFLSLGAEFQQPVVSHDLFNVLDLDGDGFSLTQCILKIEFHVFLHFPILVGGSRRNAAFRSMWLGVATGPVAVGESLREEKMAVRAVYKNCFSSFCRRKQNFCSQS